MARRLARAGIGASCGGCRGRSAGRRARRGVGAHEHDVGGLDPYVGAADGDLEVSSDEGECIDDADADMATGCPACCRRVIWAALSAGSTSAIRGVDTEWNGDPRGGGVVVSGEHDDLHTISCSAATAAAVGVKGRRPAREALVRPAAAPPPRSGRTGHHAIV